MIQAVDRSVDRIMEALGKNGLEENTMVIFTSDNGGPGYIGIPDINRPYRGWKLTMFEGGTHVPFFIKWPKKIVPGSRYTKPVSLMDIFATATGIAGADPEDTAHVKGLEFPMHDPRAYQGAVGGRHRRHPTGHGSHAERILQCMSMGLGNRKTIAGKTK